MTPAITPMPDAVAEPNTSLDAAFDALSATPDTTEQTDETQPDSTGEVQPIPEKEADAAEVADGTEKPQQVEDGVVTDGKGFRVSKERMEDLQGWRKLGEEVMSIAPSIHHLRQMRDASSDFRALGIDFQNGAADDKSMDRFLDFWQGTGSEDPTERAKLQAAFVRMADRIPDRLKQVDPRAYVALQQKMLDTKALREQNPDGYKTVQADVLRSALDVKYLEAVQKGDQKMFEKLQWAEYLLNDGNFYKDMLSVPRPDPLMTERQKLDARSQEIEKRTQTFEQQQQDARVKTWERQKDLIGNAEKVKLDELITEALKPAVGRYNDEAIQQFKVAIAANVEQQLRNDYTWYRDHEMDLDQLGRDTLERLKNNQKLSDLKPRADEYVNEYARVARAFVQRTAAQVVSAKTSSLVKQSQEKHQRLASSQKPGTAGGGTPTARPITSPTQTMEQKLDALLASVR